MAEALSRDRLYPSLLDRLLDVRVIALDTLPVEPAAASAGAAEPAA